MPERSMRLAARLWWALLPHIGYGSDVFPESRRWYEPLAYRAWKLVGLLSSSAPYKPMPPINCNCDYCRGVPGAVFEP